jgi:hypothetical protein
MKSSSTFAIVGALALVCALPFVWPQAQAQVVMQKQISPKPVWLKGEVIRFDRNSIQVREAGNELKILTFTYADSAQNQVQKALDKGGYQRDDMVRIRYVPGRSVALAIRGKLSKNNTNTTPSKPKPTPPLRPHPTSGTGLP